MIPLETIGERMFEWACRDGDYGLGAILRDTQAGEAVHVIARQRGRPVLSNSREGT
jgi:hypothetical protein